MAHDGTGDSWTESSPADGDPISDGAQEIRDLRIGLRLRVEKEHVTMTSSSTGGEHKAGSGLVYYQAAEPTNRPDGSTSLSADDKGRLWIDSDDMTLWIYSGTAWVRPLITTENITDATIATADIADEAITAALLALTLDISSITLTLPDDQGLTAPVLDTPVIADMTDAAHDHDDAAGGGDLAAKFHKCYHGTYTGDDGDRDIEVLSGFQPKVVILIQTTTSFRLIVKTAEMAGEYAFVMGEAGAYSDAVIALYADGFKVMTDGTFDTNTSGKTYFWIAWG